MKVQNIGFIHFEENFLLEAELLHWFGRGKINFPGDGATLEDFRWHLGLVLDLRHRPEQKLSQ